MKKRPSRLRPKTVYVTVLGGSVQNVDVPEGVIVIVRDYDIDDCTHEPRKKDANGDRYVESIWPRKR